MQVIELLFYEIMFCTTNVAGRDTIQRKQTRNEQMHRLYQDGKSQEPSSGINLN